jgi:hypothetical protein
METAAWIDRAARRGGAAGARARDAAAMDASVRSGVGVVDAGPVLGRGALLQQLRWARRRLK